MCNYVTVKVQTVHGVVFITPKGWVHTCVEESDPPELLSHQTADHYSWISDTINQHGEQYECNFYVKHASLSEDEKEEAPSMLMYKSKWTS